MARINLLPWRAERRKQRQRRFAQLHVLRTRGGQQHLDHFRVVGHRAEHLEIEVHFLDRVRDVVDRLELDLGFQVVLVQLGGHRDDLGDHRRAGHRGRGVPGPGAGAVDRAPDGLAHRLDLDDVLLDHRVGRQRLDRVVFDTVSAADLPQLEQLDRGRTDVDADQRRLAFRDEPHGISPADGHLTGCKLVPLH